VKHDHEQPERDGGERPPLLVLRCDQPPAEPVTGAGGGVPQMTHRVSPGGRLGANVSYGQPAPGAGASAVSTWPVRGSANMFSGPFHTVAVMNSVLRPGPPSAHAAHPRSSSIACSTSPPSRTRTHCWLGTSPYQTAFSVSRQMPSGT